jgi:hypothetical protein
MGVPTAGQDAVLRHGSWPRIDVGLSSSITVGQSFFCADWGAAPFRVWWTSEAGWI